MGGKRGGRVNRRVASSDVANAERKEPDALIWREDGHGRFLCAHCVTSEARKGGDTIGTAYRAAILHLWTSHSLKHVWLQEDRPDLAQASQLALPLVAAHNTQFDRSW